MQKHVNLVDLVKSFPTNISLQNLASIKKRTSPLKFDHLAEKSEKGSISNLSTEAREPRAAHREAQGEEEGEEGRARRGHREALRLGAGSRDDGRAAGPGSRAAGVRSEVNNSL